MGMKDDDMLPDERALLEGKTPSADTGAADDTTSQAAGDDAAPGSTPPGDQAPAGATDDEGAIDQATLEAVASDDATPARPTYDTPEARDFKAERTALRAQESEIEKKWGDGEITDEERAAQLTDVRDKLDDALREQTRADTIADLNRQSVIQTQQQVLAGISDASRKAGELDYTDSKVATAYDRMLGAVMADPDNGSKSFAELAQLAHDGLCAVRGVKRGAPPPPPPPAADTPTTAAPGAKPAAAARPQIPQTLSGMPAAAATPVSNDMATSLAAMDDPDAAEAMLASLSAGQRQQLLRSTMPGTGRR